jgi:carbamoyl-phosphate synthase small subunit
MPNASSGSSPAPVARLALADGSVFVGKAFGATGKGVVASAEVVFNTAISGYQESLTDPSYTGQILVATFPLIGNVGTNAEDVESHKVQVSGLVVRELARLHSNYRADADLSTYLARFNVLGISGVDTRAITRRLRTTGAIQGVLTDRADLSDAQLVEMARSAPSMAGMNLVPAVGCASSQSWSETLGDWSPDSDRADSGKRRVLALDCGAKRNILRNLTDRGCVVTLVPHTITAREIRERFDKNEIDGLFVSNGPGDPAAVDQVIQTLREIVRDQHATPIPTFGICLGHQLLSLALGASTFKLKFGHRGINQPILDQRTGKIEITSQNHGFAVDPDSLRKVGGEPTHIHLNDGTLAGFRVPGRPVFAVQYHPEASPGPHDSSYLFDEFVAAMDTARGAKGREPATTGNR